jgi:Na+-driven multidrug efflux pump
MLTSCGICVVVISTLATLVSVFPGTFLGIFVKEPEIIAAGTVKLRIISWSYILYAVSEVILGCLRGMKKTTFTTAINIISICGVRLMWIWAVCPMDPQNTTLLYLCYPVSYIFSLTALAIYYCKVRKSAQANLAAQTA